MGACNDSGSPWWGRSSLLFCYEMWNVFCLLTFLSKILSDGRGDLPQMDKLCAFDTRQLPSLAGLSIPIISGRWRWNSGETGPQERRCGRQVVFSPLMISSSHVLIFSCSHLPSPNSLKTIPTRSSQVGLWQLWDLQGGRGRGWGQVSQVLLLLDTNLIIINTSIITIIIIIIRIIDLTRK